MAFEKNICELGAEYFETAEKIKERIAQRLAKLRVLRAADKMLTDEAYIVKSELSTLYREYNDAVGIASYLTGYYSNGSSLEKLLE